MSWRGKFLNRTIMFSKQSFPLSLKEQSRIWGVRSECYCLVELTSCSLREGHGVALAEWEAEVLEGYWVERKGAPSKYDATPLQCVWPGRKEGRKKGRDWTLGA
jgi:hypothetical protein